MKSAWRIIEEKYPHISASGCGAHGVNLCVKDIVSTTDATKTVKDAEKIIKYVKNHHIVKTKFNDKRIAAYIFFHCPCLYLNDGLVIINQ